MKAVLISIQPKWVEKITIGKKTIEVRKTRPKLETPFKCYIYCTIGNGAKGDFLVSSGIQCGKVIGEFVCDRIDKIEFDYEFFGRNIEYDLDNKEVSKTCLTRRELRYYGQGSELYGWHISDLKIYDKPKELFDFANYDKYQVCKERNCFSDNCWICPNNAIVIRPPQSWCYVESLGE